MKPEQIQLSRSELELVRHHGDDVLRHFTAVAEMILAKLGRKPLPLGPGGIVEIRFRPNNTKTIIYSSEGLSGGTRAVGVMEDPPGICREPTEAESKA